ncbi:MAG: type IV pilus secretin PilQ [Methylomonas sp.]|jgi:type IV pilus assembly protein PilQ|uniref:type IV pilus secretin family protein n=1 Tax=Methylomonas sp. TaxID=418 RepID=UPI0025E89C52|nr:type IV pilus secretin family protein [Methylomonas sp.]MCK9607712.1 type IV pilus secretin PilQ [Methylomonas sp.]
MSTKQNIMMRNLQGQFARQWLLMLMLTLQIFSVSADETTINNLEFSTLAGNQLQIQLELSSAVVEPKIFQTDNPSRLALDFEGVKSNLAKKSFPINQGAANTVYVVEASGRTRVVINLTEKVPYETKIDGHKYYIVLKSAGSVAAVNKIMQTSAAKENALSRFLPEQSIKSIDFRRGPNGEGRLLLGLSTPNTVVDAKQSAGKVVLNFLNTKIPEALVKSFDVADFATPVQKIEAMPRGEGVTITITPNNPNYDYSSYQADNLLTVEFRPMTPAEKEAQLKEKTPYIGSKLSLNFQEIDVKAVLMILADHIKTQEGKEINIITTDSVSGSIALHVNDVPWDQVLDVVMKLRGLSKRENGNVILIGPTEEIKVLEEKELEARKVQEELEPLKTENIQINYAKAENICAILLGRSVSAAMAGASTQGSSGGRGGSTSGVSGGSGGACGSTTGMQSIGQVAGGSAGTGTTQNMRLLSTRGSVIADGRTNVLIIKDTATQLEEIHKMIVKLDIPIRQVMIEARVVIASTTFARNLGMRFGVNRNNNLTTADNASSMLSNLGYTLAAASPPGALAFTLASGANYLLSLEIDALQTEGKGQQLSNPRVLTSNLQTAHIEQGTQIPFQSSSANTGPVTEFINATLVMDVTPQITPNGSIIMDIEVQKDAPGTAVPTGTGTALQIEKKNVKTSVQVEDGETVVLGGVYEANLDMTKQKVPWFGDLPLFGWLFTPSDNVNRDDKTELLIFVTPKVVKPNSTAN